MTDRIEQLLAELTLEEKVSMLAGADAWHTQGVPRLGIPGLKVTDGPNGARGANPEGSTAACFPCGTALAATWNPELVEQVGVALAQEARSKGAHVLLAPTVNIHRSPLAGRNFECYAEDPHLAARTAVAFVRGVQSQGVGACVKHFVCNDSEFERHSISSEVGGRALREIYLVPFEAALKEAGAWSVMSAYNRVNGTYASEHPWLLGDLLKREWSFEGFVVSDWGGTYSTVEAARAGLDLEMPGPPRFMGSKLLEAVTKGEVEESLIDDKVRRLLRVMLRTGALDRRGKIAEESVDRPEHRALARRAAAEAIVLLRNQDDLLPLDATRLRSLAVIGPNAAQAEIQGGGSSQVPPHYAVTPLDGIRARVGDAVAIAVERGCTIHRALPPLDLRLVHPERGSSGTGFRAEYFAGLAPEGEPVLARTSRRNRFVWVGRFAEQVDPQRFSLRLRGVFTAPETGVYTFGLSSAGKSRLSLDGQELIDNWTRQTRGDSFYGVGSTEVTGRRELQAGSDHTLEIEYTKESAPFLGGLRLGCLLPTPENLMDRAVEAARRAEAAVVVVGTNEEWESEGFDREGMELPGRQNELVKKIAAVNPRTVVVVNAGSPMRMDWIRRVPAVLQLWYPGQECGHALADVLFGDVNPAGRLPTTFPRRLEDNPAFVNYPGECGAVAYGEAIFVGYRYYDRKKLEPRFPFGHGLSYTRFAYGEIELDTDPRQASLPIQARIEVRNAGDRAGQEVVQLYVRDLESSLARPEQELKAFAKIALQPGEAREVRFTLDRRALAFWDPRVEDWVAEAGHFELRVGASSRDIRSRKRFRLALGD